MHSSKPIRNSTCSSTNGGPKACTTCAKAKARCISGPKDGSKCERCHRLNRQCVSQTPAPPRVKRQPKRSKVAELEKRLNDLSSQFETTGAHGDQTGNKAEQQKSRHQSSASAGSGDPISPVKSSPREDNFSHLFPPQHESPGQRRPSDPAAQGARSSTPTGRYGIYGGGSGGGGASSWTSLWPQPGEAVAMLAEYHRVAAAMFPFVIVPREMAPEFRIYRPYLWKAVMVMASVFDGPRQVKLGQELLGDITTATLLNGERTLDLLQGLQLLVAWFNYALKSSQLTHLLFLARSMCVNLGSKSGESILEGAKTGKSLDELRAYAGTYYINTLVFTTNKRTDVLMNTSHLESCCAALETAREYPSDEHLVKLVRIQQLAQSISLTMAFDPGQPATQLPLTLAIQSFQAQIETFRSSLSGELKENSALQSHILIAEILLMEIAASDQHCNSSVMLLADRLQLLWACVRALRAFLTTRLAEFNIDEPRFLCLHASDLAYGFLAGLRLLSLRLPGWDVRQISSEMRFVEMLDRQIEELSLLTARRRGDASAFGPQTPSFDAWRGKVGVVEDPFDRLLKLLRTVRPSLVMQLERHAAPAMAAAGVAAAAAATQEDAFGGGMPDFDVGELDDSFWQELLNDSMWNANGIAGDAVEP